MPLPLYLSAKQIGDVLGWSRRKAWRWLSRANALVTRNGRRYTTPELLREAFPEVWNRVVDSLSQKATNDDDY
jgi:hypothetical protein